MKLRLAPALLGLCAFGVADTSWAQEKVAPVIAAVPAQNPDLAALEPRLRAAIVGVVPEAEIALGSDYLTVNYRSEKYRTHLTDWKRDATKVAAEDFPADFAEFSLSVSVDRDVMYHRFDTVPQIKEEKFGATSTSRANLKRLDDFGPTNTSSNAFADVPLEHWAYAGYGKLVQATSGENRDAVGRGRILTRYEFAVGIARCLEKEMDEKTKADKNLADLIAILRSEFAVELSRINGRLDVLDAGLGVVSSGPAAPPKTPPITAPVVSAPLALAPERARAMRQEGWQPRYEHLSLRFSYGKGVDPALVEKIKKVVADYAAERLKASTTEDEGTVQK